MKSLASVVCVALGAIIATGLGCASERAPEFKAGPGQVTAEVEYPAAPYGISEGSTVANYQFVGYADAKLNTMTMQPLQLADFYNPHGKDTSYQPATPDEDDRLFPQSSVYAPGTPKPRVLLVQLASVWCGPCNEEAGTVLPAQHKKYAPCGGEFFLQLADGPTPGTAATPKNLLNWTTKYKVDYPSSIDPEYKLSAVSAANVYPTNLIIDTTTMKIVKIQSGEVVVKGCNDGPLPCTGNSFCQSCQSLDGTTATYCGDGSPCTSDADCSALKCELTDFWKTYEDLLDKSRAGCTVQ